VTAAATLDLAMPRRIHVVAAGGAAMSALARFLVALGHDVTGSDARESSTVRALEKEGIPVRVGHDAANLPDDVDYVVVSTAVRSDNPELVAARGRGVPVLWRGEAMEAIVRTAPKVAVVSGTHGKTSTTSMLAAILDAAGRHPSWFIGGTPVGRANAHHDADGEWIVVEGDESDHSFLEFHRDAALVTNIEADHLDKWGDLDQLRAGFETFVRTTTGPVVLCRDDGGSAGLLAVRPDAVTYGWNDDADVRAIAYAPTPEGSRVTVVRRTAAGESGKDVLELRLRGRDMALNALGAATLAQQLGVEWDEARDALAGFGGVARRFQHRSTVDGIDLYDDYAHTATEVAATLARAREGPWRRVVAVFQPHRYTRISRHWHDFGESFTDADLLVVTGLDGAFEDPIAGVDGRLVVRAVLDAHPATDLVYLPEWESLADVPWRYARAGDVVVTLGCGTITEAHDVWRVRAEQRAGTTR
jgi:UDP-N-acetylmuramate--alanine ligase